MDDHLSPHGYQAALPRFLGEWTIPCSPGAFPAPSRAQHLRCLAWISAGISHLLSFMIPSIPSTQHPHSHPGKGSHSSHLLLPSGSQGNTREDFPLPSSFHYTNPSQKPVYLGTESEVHGGWSSAQLEQRVLVSAGMSKYQEAIKSKGYPHSFGFPCQSLDVEASNPLLSLVTIY